MILIKTAHELVIYLQAIRKKEAIIGFVPTMGALHNGHIALIENCRQQSNYCVASIFINPTQFNDSGDFEKYPVTIETDIYMLEQAGCDMLFLPAVNEIYPAGTTQLPHFDLGYLENIWEGQYRPGHFQGVCQVMSRLLSIVMPHKLFMGQKDYQQCLVIQKLIAIHSWEIELMITATIRESSGLAMSSRNMRLNEADKQKATAIYKALLYMKHHVQPGNIDWLRSEVENSLREAGFDKTDYAAITDAETLLPVTEWDGTKPLTALIAAYISGVRLIDNMRICGLWFVVCGLWF